MLKMLTVSFFHAKSNDREFTLIWNWLSVVEKPEMNTAALYSPVGKALLMGMVTS